MGGRLNASSTSNTSDAAAALAAAAAAAAAANKPLPANKPLLQVRACRGENGEFGAHGSIQLQQDADAVYHFMRQVEEQPKWHAGVKACEVVARPDARTTLVKQVVRWSFLALRGDFALQLSMREAPHARTITTEMTQGSMMRRFSSHVGVTRTGPSACCLEMTLLMQPNICVPLGVRHLVGGQVRKQVHGLLSSIKDTLDSQQQRRTRAQPPPQLGAALSMAAAAAPFASLHWPPMLPQTPLLLHLAHGSGSSGEGSGSSAAPLAACSSRQCRDGASSNSPISGGRDHGSHAPLVPCPLQDVLDRLLKLQPLDIAAW